jgi:hypothetical protein
MARVVNEACPRCGAALTLAPNVESVKCHYCGHVSVIEWPSARKAPNARPPIADVPLPPDVGRIQVRSSNPGVAFALAAVFVIVPVIGALTMLVTRSASRQRPTVVDVPAIPMPGPMPTATKASGSVEDIADVVARARTVALAAEPHATKLGMVVAFEVKHGALDTGQSNAASVQFPFRFQDPSMPPGKDMNEGSINVHVANGAFTPMKINAAFQDRDLGTPTCSSRAAWATAVKTGVPEDAIATFHLYDNTPFSPKSPTVWSIRVEGHDEYRREIDAMNCKLVKSWDEKKKH